MSNNTKDDRPSKWTVKKKTLVHQSPWYPYVHDHGLRDDGKPFDYFYIDSKRSVGVIALTDDGQVVMVRQYRYTTNSDSLEVPGGGEDDSQESTEDLAKRELLEETGYQADQLVSIGEFDVANGYTSDIAYVFLARNCQKVSEPKHEQSEEGMRVKLHSVEEVYEMIQDGKITDAFTLSAFMLAWPHLL